MRNEELPVRDEKFSVINCQSIFFFIDKKVNDTLGNTFSKKNNVLRVEVTTFERNFDNENLFNLGTLGDSRQSARSNPVNEVKTRHISIETITLRWLPVEPLIKLCLRQWSFDFGGLRQP